MELHEKGYGLTLNGKIRNVKLCFSRLLYHTFGVPGEQYKKVVSRTRRSSTEMFSGYIAAVLEHLLKADLVLDHFHLIKLFNEKLSLLRRQLYHQATDVQKAVLKGIRWRLLKAPENLKSHRDHKKDERIRLEAALELNQPLAIAYYVEERLRLLFQCTNQHRAEMEIKAWIQGFKKHLRAGSEYSKNPGNY